MRIHPSGAGGRKNPNLKPKTLKPSTPVPRMRRVNTTYAIEVPESSRARWRAFGFLELGLRFFFVFFEIFVAIRVQGAPGTFLEQVGWESRKVLCKMGTLCFLDTKAATVRDAGSGYAADMDLTPQAACSQTCHEER